MKFGSKPIYATLLACSFIAAGVQAETFVFHTGSASGAAGDAFDDDTTDSYTQNNITLTASASGPGSDSVFNVTSSSFGINAEASGDDTDQFDTGAGGAEIMTFSFNEAGTFDSIDFASLTEDTETEAVLSFTGGNTFNINNANTDGGDVFTLSTPEAFTANQQITLSTSSDNHNFALQSFTVTIPEPASLALVGLGGLLIAGRRRRSA
jgi:hypothetical protein